MTYLSDNLHDELEKLSTALTFEPVVDFSHLEDRANTLFDIGDDEDEDQYDDDNDDDDDYQ